MHIHMHNLILSCVDSTALKNAAFGEASDLIHTLLDNLQCTGNEESLLECNSSSNLLIGQSDCSHSEDASVNCEGTYTKSLHIIL